MFRRGLVGGYTGMTSLCWSFRSISTEARDDLTRNFNKVKEEAKGQALDLADMCDAGRATHKSLQAAHSRHTVDDKAFRLKMTTLNATFKAYNSRLNNLQNEAKAIQNDTEKLLKLLWGQDKNVTTPPTSAAPDVDFGAEEIIIEEKPSSNTSKVETVEAEVVEEKATTTTPTTDTTNTVPETEVELEIESVEVDPVEEMSITDITKELHEKDVSFSDCLDAKSLRKRYREYKEGKAGPTPPKKATPPPPRAEQPEPPKNVYQDPSYQQFMREHQNARSGPANTNESGVVPEDPHTARKQIDPMRLVGELKNEIAKDNNVGPHMLDLYCGQILMDDNKRLYEYPGLARGDRINAVSKGQAPPPG